MIPRLLVLKFFEIVEVIIVFQFAQMTSKVYTTQNKILLDVTFCIAGIVPLHIGSDNGLRNSKVARSCFRKVSFQAVWI